MIKESVITTKIVVPPHKFQIYKDYIKKILYSYEGKNYSNEIGYIIKIIDITNIKIIDIIKSDFSGNLIYEVSFIVQNCNPNIQDEVDCEIIQNENILFGRNNPLQIIIIADENTNDLNIGDNIKIKILGKEVKYNDEYIKIVGKFIKKLN